MKWLLMVVFLVLLLLLLLTPTQACPPAAASYGYAAQQSCYVAPAQTYYQTQTVLAYPLTLLAAPAVTVVAQPAVPASAPAPAPQPQPVPQPVPQAEVQTQAQVVAPQAAIVQRQVYATYAVPLAAVVSHSYAYGAAAGVGYGTNVVVNRAVVRHRAAAVVVQRQRRVGPIRALFQRIAVNRAQRRVPSSTTVIVR